MKLFANDLKILDAAAGPEHHESAEGVSISLSDLIALQRFVDRKPYYKIGHSIAAGFHQARWRGRGMDFVECRHYQAGDDLRHMEWKITARRGKPHVKIFEEEKERPVYILLDFNSSMFFGSKKAFKSVIAAQLAALIGWTVVKQGDRLGALLLAPQKTDVFMPKMRAQGLLPILEKIAEYTKFTLKVQNDESNTIANGLAKLKHCNRPGSTIVIISDFYSFNEEARRHLSGLRKNNTILAYQIVDPLELAPPKPACYPLVSENGLKFLDLSNKKIREAYENWAINRQKDLAESLKQLNCPQTVVMSVDFLPFIVQKTFQRSRF